MSLHTFEFKDNPEIADELTDKDTSDLSVWQRIKANISARKQSRSLAGMFSSYPHLLALKPKERYVFHSDYFDVDDQVACIMAFFHDEGAIDGFGPFWGIDRIPHGLGEGVTFVVLDQVAKYSDKWVDAQITNSERMNNLAESETAEGKSASAARRSAKVARDTELVSAEIQNGAAYLNVHMRLLVKAPNLELLDEAMDKVARLYIDRFATLRVAGFPGQQRDELTRLWWNNDRKLGKGFDFTSLEYAGAYSMVTNGLADPGGEYVGYMVGDANNSAVLMDVNKYRHHVVLADETKNDFLSGQRLSAMWASKCAQSAMLRNASAVHIVLDSTDLSILGPRFDGLTARLDMNSGDVNPFEMFGSTDDELAVFSSQMQKLKLMFNQMYESTDGATGAIIDSELEAIATDFYVEQGMWRHNAKENRDKLRVVGIPHDQVPRLQMFASYVATAHKALVNSSKNDPKQLEALNVLKGIANTMLSTNGDLFNNITSDAVDKVASAKRVVYDFSDLLRRGKGVAMAQLVNIIGFAVGVMKPGDVVIFHGAENIDERIKDYLNTQFASLWDRGGRVVYAYNSVEAMLDDSRFNRFDTADYTVLGPMTPRLIERYQEILHQRIPHDLAGLLCTRDANLSYLRRDVTNVVFYTDLALGVNPAREKLRRAGLGSEQRSAQRANIAAQINTKTGSNQPAVASEPKTKREVKRMARGRSVRK